MAEDTVRKRKSHFSKATHCIADLTGFQTGNSCQKYPVLSGQDQSASLISTTCRLNIQPVRKMCKISSPTAIKTGRVQIHCSRHNNCCLRRSNFYDINKCPFFPPEMDKLLVKNKSWIFFNFIRLIQFSGCIMLGMMLSGCGESVPQMDTSKVNDPLGKAGVCERCQEKIEEVTEEHLVIVRGNQYIICDEKCEADLKDWLSKQ